MRGNFLGNLYQGPLSWLPRGWDHGDIDYFSALLASEDIVYIAIGAPYDPALEARGLGLGPPLLRKPLGWSPYFGYSGNVQAVYFCDHHSYISHAGDIPPSHPFPAILDSVYSIEVGIGGSEQDRLAGGAVSLGDMRIENGTGENDALVNYSWGGRGIEIRAGLADWPLSRFSLILRGGVANVRADDSAINLGLVSNDGVLDNPVTRIYYAGTGGIEGPVALAGAPVAIALGRLRSVPMVLLDQATQIYRIAEQLDAVLSVRDIGLEVTDSGSDYGTYALLAAATVAAGHYATCLSLGLVRFGSNVSVPTADVDGPVAWGNTPATIIEYLLKNRLGRFSLTAAGIDGGSFNRADADRGWTTGLLIDADTTMRPMTDRLARDIGGWVLPNRRGLFQIGLYERPTMTVGDIVAADVDDAGPELIGRWRAVRRLVLGYKPMQRVLSAAEMSETVSATDRNLLGRQYRTVEETRSVADRDAVDYAMTTGLDTEADAAALAEILADLLSWATHRWRVPLRTLPLRYWAGDRRTFRYERHGLDSGAPFLITRVIESDSGDSSIEIWGGRP